MLNRILTELVNRVPDEGRILVVSHGGIVEASVFGCLPELDVTDWGESIAVCEGIELAWDNGKWVGARVIRES